MKKFEDLGKKLSKEEQKKIMGGDPPPLDCGNTCIPSYPPGSDNCPRTCPCGQFQIGIWKCNQL